MRVSSIPISAAYSTVRAVAFAGLICASFPSAMAGSEPSEGLPGRPWYRHQLYAPGFYTGYGVKTLPRVREAIESERYDEVDESVAHTAVVLQAFVEHLGEIETIATGPHDD